jgi:hypothetical protein
MTTFPALTRSRAVRSILRLLTAIWIATGSTASLPQPMTAIAGERSSRPLVLAVSTGQFDRGTPIYRLPSITVSARRNVAALESPAPKNAGHSRGTLRARAPS